MKESAPGADGSEDDGLVIGRGRARCEKWSMHVGAGNPGTSSKGGSTLPWGSKQCHAGGAVLGAALLRWRVLH